MVEEWREGEEEGKDGEEEGRANGGSSHSCAASKTKKYCNLVLVR